MDRRIAPSARIEEAIERTLLDGLDATGDASTAPDTVQRSLLAQSR